MLCSWCCEYSLAYYAEKCEFGGVISAIYAYISHHITSVLCSLNAAQSKRFRTWNITHYIRWINNFTSITIIFSINNKSGRRNTREGETHAKAKAKSPRWNTREGEGETREDEGEGPQCSFILFRLTASSTHIVNNREAMALTSHHK